MLYLIGLGLADEQDITSKGLEALKKCTEVYAELYTNPFSGDLLNLEKIINKKIKVLKRPDLEEGADKWLPSAHDNDIALLVPGDPMVATTHLSIILTSEKLGIKTEVIHSSSIYSAIGETGLQIYKFGKTASLPFPEPGYFPNTPYKILEKNLNQNAHTLLLLDVKTKEKKFMTIPEAIEILLELGKKVAKKPGFTEETHCLGIARLGSQNQKIKFGKAKELLKVDFGKAPHTLIVPGKLHFLEEEALERFK